MSICHSACPFLPLFSSPPRLSIKVLSLLRSLSFLCRTTEDQTCLTYYTKVRHKRSPFKTQRALGLARELPILGQHTALQAAFLWRFKPTLQRPKATFFLCLILGVFINTPGVYVSRFRLCAVLRLLYKPIWSSAFFICCLTGKFRLRFQEAGDPGVCLETGCDLHRNKHVCAL